MVILQPVPSPVTSSWPSDAAIRPCRLLSDLLSPQVPPPRPHAPPPPSGYSLCAPTIGPRRQHAFHTRAPPGDPKITGMIRKSKNNQPLNYSHPRNSPLKTDWLLRKHPEKLINFFLKLKKKNQLAE